MENFDQLMLFKPEDVFKASWKDKNYKKLNIQIDRIPVPKQSDRTKIIPKGKGLGKMIGHEYYYRISDLFIHHYQEAKITDEIKSIKWIIKSIIGSHKPFEEEVIIASLDFVFPVLTSMSKSEKEAALSGAIIPKISKPDWDNLVKMFMDCCNRLVWKDDALIWWTNNIRKRYGEKGQINMELYGR